MLVKTRHFDQIDTLDSGSELRHLFCVSLEGIKEALHHTPFRPFVIRMTSGKEYVVEHQDFIGASKTYRRLFVATNEDDRVDILDTLMIESLHYIGPEKMAA
jgi:hypothetical protein